MPISFSNFSFNFVNAVPVTPSFSNMGLNLLSSRCVSHCCTCALVHVVKSAATVFHNVIAKMSGSKLDIVNEPTGKVKTKVWYGKKEMTKLIGMVLKEVKFGG